MLSGLRFEKQVDAKTDKKSKKKERRKEQKKKKKRKQKDKKKKAASSSSSSDSSIEQGATAKEAENTPAAVEVECQAVDGKLGTEDDFFNSLGKETKQGQKMKPDPDKLVVHARELNPCLKGEEVSQRPTDLDVRLPKHLTVGDGGRAWRKRAQKRAEEAVVESRDPSVPILQKLSTEVAPGDEGGAPKRAKGNPDDAIRPRDPPVQNATPDDKSAAWRKRAKGRVEEAVTETEDRDGVQRVPNAVKGDDKENVEENVEEVLRKVRSKYGVTPSTVTTAAPETQSGAVAPQKEPEDGNELAAMAMQAMLSGDMERYEELNRRLEQIQSDVTKGQSTSSTAAGNLTRGPDGERIEIIEEVDAAGRSRSLVESVQSTSVGTGVGQKGNKNRAKQLKGVGNVGDYVNGKKEKGFYEDDEISLEDLIRRERIEGVQDYDSNFAEHIIKHKSYKPIHEDDDEAYGLGMYESASKKADAKRLAAKRQKQEINEKKRIAHNLEHCRYCIGSKRFRMHDQIISSSEHAYICADGFKDCILPGQTLIIPKEHFPSMTDLDDTAYSEIRNYQKCLVRYFDAQQPPKAVIFAESAIIRVSKEKLLLGAGPHAVMVAYPVDLAVFGQARSFFRKAFDEAECEFETQHKKVIETSAKGGVRASIPKHFPYVHIDFCLQGGYAHIVEETSEFPREFAQQTIAGMCELTILDRAYSTKEEYWENVRPMKEKFRREFDWTKS